MTDQQAILATSLQSSALQTDVDTVPAVAKDFASTAQSQLQSQSQPQQQLAKKRSLVEESSSSTMGTAPSRTAKATGRVRKQVIRESKLSKSTFDETELEAIYHQIVNDLQQQQRSSKSTLSSTGMDSSNNSSSNNKEEETKLWLRTNETKWKTQLQHKNISRAVWISFWQKVAQKFETMLTETPPLETQEEESAPALTKEPSTLVVHGTVDNDDWSFLVVGQAYNPGRLDFLQWDSLEPLP